jgi:hypothetical protein
LLFVTTAGIVVAVALVLFAGRVISTLDSLDTRARQLEDQLVSLYEQEARSEGIREAYAEVQEQHSSAWSGEEIHDRLRREIDRLSLRTPYPEGGSPPGGAASQGDYLVFVPRMTQGTLSEEENYREYRITLRANPTTLDAIITFLARLQQSNQSLWIDRLVLTRSPEETQIASEIVVNRAVLAGTTKAEVYVSEEPTLERLRNPSFEYWRLNEKRFPAWEGEGVVMGDTDTWVTDGSRGLEASTIKDDARVFQAVDVMAGREYEMSVDIATTSPGRVGVDVEGGEFAAVSGQDLIADGEMYRYRLTFRVPGAEGEIVRLHAPVVVSTQSGSVIHMDNANLRSIGS